jgi:hypothetical protein
MDLAPVHVITESITSAEGKSKKPSARRTLTAKVYDKLNELIISLEFIHISQAK